jgi:hypothetical protein
MPDTEWTKHATYPPRSNTRSGSTKSSDRGVKLSTFPRRVQAQPAKPLPLAFPARRRLSDPVRCKVSFRSGATAWVQVEANGRTYWFPGALSILEVCLRIHGQ